VSGLVYLFKRLNEVDIASDAERKRILAMVESGKIGTEEASELIDAIGKSRIINSDGKFSRLDIMILIGCGLVIVGFFLPWTRVSIAGMQGYQYGYDIRVLGWAVLVIAVLATAAVFITSTSFLYKISILQIFLCIVGATLVVSKLFQVIRNLRIGLPICMLGFILAAIACFAKLKKLTA
jgi:hypothetical protein